MTIAKLFPDTPLKKALFGTALLVSSYLAAGLVNASPVVQPRLSRPSRGALILMVPPPAGPHVPSQLPSKQPHRAL